MMLKYIVGWAWGFALQEQLSELKEALPALCAAAETEGAAPSCLTLDVAVTLTMTALSGLVLLRVRPWATQVEFGEGAGRRRCAKSPAGTEAHARAMRPGIRRFAIWGPPCDLPQLELGKLA